MGQIRNLNNNNQNIFLHNELHDLLMNNHIFINENENQIFHNNFMNIVYGIINASDDEFNTHYENYFNQINNLLLSQNNNNINQNNINQNNINQNNITPSNFIINNIIYDNIIDVGDDVVVNDIPINDTGAMAGGGVATGVLAPTREPLTLDGLTELLQNDCSICYEPMQLIDFTITRCAHAFHGPCLQRALAHNACCPNCRTSL
jgi:hypothetical protein